MFVDMYEVLRAETEFCTKNYEKAWQVRNPYLGQSRCEVAYYLQLSSACKRWNITCKEDIWNR